MEHAVKLNGRWAERNHQMWSWWCVLSSSCMLPSSIAIKCVPKSTRWWIIESKISFWIKHRPIAVFPSVYNTYIEQKHVESSFLTRLACKIWSLGLSLGSESCWPRSWWWVVLKATSLEAGHLSVGPERWLGRHCQWHWCSSWRPTEWQVMSKDCALHIDTNGKLATSSEATTTVFSCSHY